MKTLSLCVALEAIGAHAWPFMVGSTDPKMPVFDNNTRMNALLPNASIPSKLLPFDRMIVFGDDYSDNSQGSFAHGITGDNGGDRLWGAGTWTDGPVAVSYLSGTLGIPLSYDYAFGSSRGGQFLGSVCNTSAVKPGQLSNYARLNDGTIVPDAIAQVNNYTSNTSTNSSISRTLHVLWTGNNDVIASLGWVGRFTICTDNLCTPSQKTFLAGFNTCMQSTLMKLVAAGAKYILVPNIYPRHLTPWTSMWITSEPGHVTNFGGVIDQANAQTAQLIASINAKYGTKIMYFDANNWMQTALKNANLSGVGPGQGGVGAGYGYNYTCVDGCPVQAPLGVGNWALYWANTILGKRPDDFFWMTETVASTTVHKTLASAMFNYLIGQVY